MTTKYQQVKRDFLSGRLKGCRDYFETHNYPLEAGYCYMVLDNFVKAKELFEKAKVNDIRGHWGLMLLQMIEEKISMSPTYFEVRNFLEADLDIFMTYCKGDIVQQIIKYADFMAFYNMECYKFIGRAFWAHNFMTPAMYFLQKAQDNLYKDPELHYLLAYIYYTNKDIKNCTREIDICLEILPQYAPAMMLKRKINT